MVARGRTAAPAQIEASYSPRGTDVHSHVGQGPTRRQSALQAASWLVYAFLQGSRSWPTHRDKPRNGTKLDMR